MNVSKFQALSAALTAAVLTLELKQRAVKDTQSTLEKQESELADAKTAAHEAKVAMQDEVNSLDDYGEDKDPETPEITGTPTSDGATIIPPAATDPTGAATVEGAPVAPTRSTPLPIPLPNEPGPAAEVKPDNAPAPIQDAPPAAQPIEVAADKTPAEKETGIITSTIAPDAIKNGDENTVL